MDPQLREDTEPEEVLRSSLICPNCGSRTSKVLLTTDKNSTFTSINRRRECLNCGERYNTKEIHAAALEKIIADAITFAQDFVASVDDTLEIAVHKKFKKKEKLY